ncbi:MAG: hypothetical protein JXX29_20135 [Deltaproteobacteria bacterium]|nr:hypothetical protein [Deltaproteobacteria bacterium]MBN2674002.1 hypothetical protein [Deltaproteobacteria bacterium]
MYQIEREKVGRMDVYRLEFGGFIKMDEMQHWVDDSQKQLTTSPGTFAVWVDMRNLKPLPQDAQEKMMEGQKMYKDKGMVRSAVVVPNSLVKLQFERIAKESGIHEWERYFSAEEPEWESSMKSWIEKGVN